MVVLMMAAVMANVILSPGSAVPVVTLEDGTDGPCVPSINMTNFGIGVFDAHNITICGLLKLHRSMHEDETSVIFFYNFNDKLIAAGITRSYIWMKVDFELFIFSGVFREEEWHTFCFQSADNKSLFVMNGKRLQKIDYQMDAVFEKFSGMCFGSPQVDPPSAPASIAALSLRSGLFINTNNEEFLRCREIVSNANILPVRSSWFGRSDMIVIDHTEEELCSHTFQNLLLKQVGSYHELENHCESFGGSLLGNEDVLRSTVGIPDDNLRKCVTDEVHTTWLKTKNAGSRDLTSECSSLLFNGSVGPRPCVSELECSLCRVPVWRRFTLYGDIDLFDRYFFLRSSSNDYFFFEGMETSNITRQEDGWVLRSRLHRRSWRLPDFDPIGRRVWSSKNGNATLTLTSCSLLQFSTDDGTCLPRAKRCDGLPGSEDGSDERQCKERLVTKPPGYDKSKGPFQSAEEKGTLSYDFDVFYISHIKTEENVATIDLQHRITWHEPRVRFWDLKEDVWNPFPCKDIWYPRIGLMAGYGIGFEAEAQLYKRICVVRKQRDTIDEYDISDPYMGRVVNGAAVNITMRMAFVTTYPCLFQVYQYPFGAYQCNSTFYIKQENPFLRWEATKSSQVEYSGDHNLLDFTLRSVTHETFRDSAFISFTLHLEGQFNYHLLNSFAPSALMFCICYATLLFPLKDFNERIMVSLTAMLVLAALFAQATDSYVKTPYFKLIDIWYAALICFCFVVVIVNVIVNALRVRMEPSYDEVTTYDHSSLGKRTTSLVQLSAKKFNSLCSVVLFVLFALMMLLFILSATMVI